MPILDIAGTRFGRLVAQDYVGGSRKSWRCLCDCGSSKPVPGANLRLGKTNSCGCLKAERQAEGMGKRHGMCGTRTYKTWNSMIERCNNANDPSYMRYGGRGITVCDEWKVFENFFADMGERPVGTTIERDDVNGRYEKSNCRWATAREQANNRTNSRRIEYQGVSYPPRDLAEILGINYETLRQQVLYQGRSVDEVIKKSL